MNEFFKFLLSVPLLLLVFYLKFLSLKAIVRMQVGGGGLVSKRWAMAMKTGMISFVIGLFAFLLGITSYFLEQKWIALIAIFMMVLGFALGVYSVLGGWFLLLSGKNRQDIKVTSDWDFWKFLK